MMWVFACIICQVNFHSDLSVAESEKNTLSTRVVLLHTFDQIAIFLMILCYLFYVYFDKSLVGKLNARKNINSILNDK